jgi:hypothetical protein
VQALRRRFLVAGRAVDLPGEEEARDRLGLEARLQGARIEVVVLDRVARRTTCAFSSPAIECTASSWTWNGNEVEIPFG